MFFRPYSLLYLGHPETAQRHWATPPREWLIWLNLSLPKKFADVLETIGFNLYTGRRIEGEKVLRLIMIMIHLMNMVEGCIPIPDCEKTRIQCSPDHVQTRFM